MASEQKGNRKKPSRNTLRGEHKHPVLYRHQDCIPTSKVFHECERNNIGPVSLKSNLDIETTGKLIKEDKVSNINPTSKRLNPKLKSENTHDREVSKLPDPKLNKQQLVESDSNSEELSKSRKRRLRKQKLLVSLAPACSTNPVKLHTCIESNPQSKPVPQYTVRPSSVTAPTTGTGTGIASAANRLGDTGKQSLKESRKRLDKSVGSRNKSIKGKTLAETVIQTKADIIKSLEEKTLTSLLQTLVPLSNSSPKKEKPPVPLFSFNDKKLKSSDSKVGKDEVFYFGETKHQLENLTTGFSKGSTGVKKEKLETGQNTEVDQFNRFSADSIENLDNCVSPFNFSSVFTEQNIDVTSLKTKLSNFEAPHISKEESKAPFCFGLNNSKQDLSLKDQNPKSPIKTLGQYPAKALIFNWTPCTPSAIVINNLPIALHNKNSDLTTEVSTENHTYNKLLSVQDELKHNLSNNISTTTELEANTVGIMESMNEKVKPNKTREEIKLEREAKKAEKLAAKAKHKTAQSSGVMQAGDSSLTELKNSDIDKKTGTEVKKKIICVEKVSSNSVDNPVTSSQLINKLGTSNVKSPSQLSVKEVNNEEKVIPETLQEAVKETSAKSKAELRAARRAKQEAQRAAKVLPKQPQQKDKIVLQVKNEPKSDNTTKPGEKRQEATKTPVQPKPKLFSHLYQEMSPLTSKEMLLSGELHPAIVRLGVQYATRVIAGSNARCVALLNALKQMVTEYTTPSEKEFSRGLEEELGPVTVYLHQCRPLAVSMTNALRHIKRTLTQLPNNIPDVEARQKICDVVDTYIHEQIDVAGTAICNTVKDKIADGDVILTYGCSSLVYKILLQSHLSGKRFRVVVVDGLPWREGREMLRRLVDKGLSCTYVLITAASFIMREASKVLLGAHALLANGCVMSRAGSSQVALLAHCYNVPVLVCCEMHKFSERVQTDAFVYNELGVLESTKDKEKNRTVASLTPLSLAYDITPPDLVSAVVTELAVLPCTSVPVILRIKPSESLM